MQLHELMSPVYTDDPLKLYELFQQHGPVIQAGNQVMVIGNYALNEALLSDKRVGKDYMQSVRIRFGEQVASQPVFQGINKMFLVLNPPEHSRLRGLIMKSFSSREVQPFKEMALTLGNQLIDSFIERGRCDLAKEFAFPLPVQIICHMLDVPVTEADKLGGAAADLVRIFDPQISADDLQKAGEAYQKLYDYFSVLIQSRRFSQQDDLVSLFIRSEYEGHQLEHDEIIANVILLFIAGHETTSNMICNTVLALYAHPPQLALVKQDTRWIPDAINECLRYDSSVQMVYRIALQDLDMNGYLIPAGTSLFLMLGAANHDPDKFSDPHNLLIQRQQGRCLSFGAGIHHCLGYRLAMAELEVALQLILSRLPNMCIISSAVQRNHRINLRGVSALPVVWDSPSLCPVTHK